MEVKRRTARSLVSKLSSVSELTRTEALCELRLITKHEADSRSIIAEAGAIPYLTEILYSSSPLLQENAAATLLNLSISTRDLLMSTRGFLDALSHSLHHPSSPDAFQSSAAALFSLLTVDEFRPIIGSKRDIVYALVNALKIPNSPPRSVKDALKALFGISLYPLNRTTIVEFGAVPVLFSHVVRDGRVGIVEDATAVIAQVAGCEESGEAFRRALGVRVLVDLLDSSTGSSGRTKENAVSALLNLVQYGGDKDKSDVREMVMMGLGVFDGLADVAEHGSAKGKRKMVELLKAIDDGSNHLRDFRLCFLWKIGNVEDGEGTRVSEDHISSDENAVETDSSTPALYSNKEKLKSRKMKTRMEKKKKRRTSSREDWDISESIRWLAKVVVRSEQARMDTMREIERMRAEGEAKRLEMDLKRTEIIANTQLEIAKLLAGKGVDSSLRIGRN